MLVNGLSKQFQCIYVYGNFIKSNLIMYLASVLNALDKLVRVDNSVLVI